MFLNFTGNVGIGGPEIGYGMLVSGEGFRSRASCNRFVPNGISGDTDVIGNLEVKGTVRAQALEIDGTPIFPASVFPPAIPSHQSNPEVTDDSDVDPVVSVNVGGSVFHTRSSTLSLLGYFRRSFVWNPERKLGFIDRDPVLFSSILRMLRSGLSYQEFIKGMSPRDVLLFRIELDWFGFEVNDEHETAVPCQDLVNIVKQDSSFLGTTPMRTALDLRIPTHK